MTKKKNNQLILTNKKRVKKKKWNGLQTVNNNMKVNESITIYLC